jgi:hypothetical protein
VKNDMHRLYVLALALQVAKWPDMECGYGSHTTHMLWKESFMNYETCESWQVVFLNDNRTQQIIGLKEVAIKLLNGKAREILNVLHVFNF